MNVMEMKKADFKRVPYVEAPTKPFASLVVIPTRYLHDSGFKCMEFVAVNKMSEPICRFGGGADIVHIDGIGGYGPKMNFKSVVPHGWSIDMLPCGCVRLFPKSDIYITQPFVCSDLEVFAKDV